MNIIKATYTDKNGQTCNSRKWYIDFTDHWNRRHKLAGFTDKRATTELARKIEDLISYRTAGQSLPRELQIWIDGLPDSLIKNLVSWGLIDSQRVEGAKPLTKHLADWELSLKTTGTAKNAEMKYSRAKRVFDSCRFKSLSDISASKIQLTIANLKKSVRREQQGQVCTIETDELLSQRSQHHILTACKQFCKWARADGRTSNNPLEHLQPIKVTEKDNRAAFTTEEISVLLTATETAPARYNLTGRERALLYRLAVQTGLRAGELNRLTVDCFDLDSLTVSLSGKYTKNNLDAQLPLRADTADMLREYLACKLPTAKAFNMPVGSNICRMIHKDMEQARQIWLEKTGIADSYFLAVDNERGRRDFHALRHTFASMLAATGTHPKTAQTLLRHADIRTTMNIYTHSLRDKETSAINALPDLTSSQENQTQRATGTEGENIDAIGKKSFDVCLDKTRTKLCNSMQNPAKMTGNDQTTKNPVSEPKSAILSQKQGSFSKPPERLELSTIGLQNRSSIDINTDKTKSYKTTKKSFDCSLDKNCNFPADLQAVIDCWDSLPEHIKTAILALVGK